MFYPQIPYCVADLSHCPLLLLLPSGGSSLKDREMTTSNIRALIQALPQYRDHLAKLSLHIQVWAKEIEGPLSACAFEE